MGNSPNLATSPVGAAAALCAAAARRPLARPSPVCSSSGTRRKGTPYLEPIHDNQNEGAKQESFPRAGAVECT